jgi:hypothetical protein
MFVRAVPCRAIHLRDYRLPAVESRSTLHRESAAQTVRAGQKTTNLVSPIGLNKRHSADLFRARTYSSPRTSWSVTILRVRNLRTGRRFHHDSVKDDKGLLRSISRQLTKSKRSRDVEACALDLHAGADASRALAVPALSSLADVWEACGDFRRRESRWRDEAAVALRQQMEAAARAEAHRGEAFYASSVLSAISRAPHAGG